MYRIGTVSPVGAVLLTITYYTLHSNLELVVLSLDMLSCSDSEQGRMDWLVPYPHGLALRFFGDVARFLRYNLTRSWLTSEMSSLR